MQKRIYYSSFDGLRALSVFAVILYHLKIEFGDYFLFSGGYIGVDIFFVLSGFLISSIIFNTNAKFKVSSFYLNRFKRIFPLLIFVIIITFSFAYLFLLPEKLLKLSESSISSLLGFSNLYYFFSYNEYGADESLLLPLLHTWSLSIELQYYIFFPIFVILLKNLNLKFEKLLPYLIIFFLIINIVIEKINTSFNFYFFHSRVFEFLIGSFLYFNYEKIRKIHLFKKSENLLVFFSYILLFMSVMFFNEKTPHPSIITIIPVLSCSILILSSKNNLSYLLLNSHYLRFIGKISFSLYMIHFPVFALLRILNIFPNSFFGLSVLILFIFLISIPSYHYIEKYFRSFEFKIDKKLFYFFGSTIICLILLNLFTIRYDGFKGRFNGFLDEVNNQVVPWKTTKQNEKECWNRTKNFCFFDFNSKQNLILIGDSHMGSIQDQLVQLSKELNLNLILMNINSCFFSKNAYLISRSDMRVDDRCNLNAQLNRLNMIEKNSESIIIIGARFSYYFNEMDVKYENGRLKEIKSPRFLNIGKNTQNRHKERQNKLVKDFTETMQSLLNNNQVILIYPFPEFGRNVRQELKNKIAKNPFFKSKNFFVKENYATISYEEFLSRNKFSNQVLDRFQNKNLKRVYPENIFCNPQKNKCYSHDKKNLFFYDEQHLTLYGSKLLIDLLRKKIEKNL